MRTRSAGRWLRALVGSRAAPGADASEALTRLVSVTAGARGLIGELERQVETDARLGALDVLAMSADVLGCAREAVGALAAVTGRRERWLSRAVDRLAHGIADALRHEARNTAGPLVLDVSDMAGVSPALIGKRIHRLAQIRLAAGAPTPDGFAITSAACHALLAQPEPWRSIEQALEPPPGNGWTRLASASPDIRSRLLATPWPEPVAAAILAAFDALLSRTVAGQEVRVAVRPSGADEDGESGQAGRYESILTVNRDRLLAACREAVAAQFGPGAAYRDAFGDSRIALRPMAVSVTRMVHILASGVLHTRMPEDPDAEVMLVRGSWGLAPPVTGGPAATDHIRVSRREGHNIRVADIATKARMRLAGVDGGVVTVDVPGWMREQPCLTRAQASALAEYGVRLEDAFDGPQEVDWVLDRAERLVVMRSRLSLPAARPGDAGRRQSGALRRRDAALALVTPLTLPPPSPARNSAEQCRTLHDVLCYTYERGVEAAGASATSARWPGRPGALEG